MEGYDIERYLAELDQYILPEAQEKNAAQIEDSLNKLFQDERNDFFWGKE
jgi:hypothetical protein